jgi:ankyrin repeat protein
MAELCAILDAAKAGDVATITQWLAGGANPDQHDEAGWSPLLWAAARGQAELVSILLKGGADPRLGHALSAMLPVHVAGQCGDVETVKVLLDAAPDTLNVQYDINGHTVLLQAVFYGHLPLAQYLVERGADTAIPTARGLGPLELALQFQAEKMAAVMRPYDKSADEKSAAYQRYLARIAPDVPEAEKPLKALSDKIIATIEAGLKATNDGATTEAALATIRDLVDKQGAEIDRLGGPLQQPPIIAAVTGINGFPANSAVAKLRLDLVAYLLGKGANPLGREKHPMGAQPVIRAAVFNHLEILKLLALHCPAQDYADAINEVPLVNGLTAMHDSVLRASMAAPDRRQGYLDQISFFVSHGGRSDLEDFSGTTQRQLAEKAADKDVRDKILAIFDGRA